MGWGDCRSPEVQAEAGGEIPEEVEYPSNRIPPRLIQIALALLPRRPGKEEGQPGKEVQDLITLSSRHG